MVEDLADRKDIRWVIGKAQLSVVS
jgi:hypothetical protein